MTCCTKSRIPIELNREILLQAESQRKEEWGILDVEQGGLLMCHDWKTVRVSTPLLLHKNPLRGEGWTLHLSTGWRARPPADSNDWEIVRELKNMGLNP